MKRSFLSMTVLAVLALAGCATPAQEDVHAASVEPVALSFAPGVEPWFHVFEVADDHGLEYEASFNLTVSLASHPWMLLFIHPNGTVDVLSHWAFDNGQWGYGEGVVYASVDGESVRSPSLGDGELPPLRAEWGLKVGAVRGHFVLAWTGFTEPGDFRFLFPASTSVREVASGPVSWHGFHNFTRGVSAGALPAVGVGAGLAVDLTPDTGRQTLGLVSTYSNRDSFGGARLVVGGEEHELPFTGFCPNNCEPVTLRSAVFATGDAASVHVDWAGSHGDTRVVVTYLDLPAATLPDTVHVFQQET